MTTTWPAYEGSVITSWYPVMQVLNTTSPLCACSSWRPEQDAFVRRTGFECETSAHLRHWPPAPTMIGTRAGSRWITRPPAMVSSTVPRSVAPRSGVLRDRDCSGVCADGPLRGRVEERARRRLADPAAAARGRRTPGPRIRCGPTVIRSTSVASHSPPMPPMVMQVASAVSRPIMPGAASSYASDFSAAGWGAWSVATASMRPSRSASTSAFRSRLRAQRWVDLAQRLGIRLLRDRQPHREVVGRDLRAHGEALVTRAPQRRNRTFGGQMLEVQVSGARVRQRANREVHRARLGLDVADRAARHRALRCIRLRDHLLVLGVHEHRAREVRGFRKRDRELAGRHTVASVVADRDRTRLDALANVDQLGALESASERGDLQDRHRQVARGEARFGNPLRSVDRRHGVGHRHHVRESARRGCTRSALERLGLVITGLTQVGVQVDESGAEHARVGAVLRRQVDHRDAGRVDVVIDGEDLAAVEPDVLTGCVEAAERVDDADAAQDRVHGDAPAQPRAVDAVHLAQAHVDAIAGGGRARSCRRRWRAAAAHDARGRSASAPRPRRDGRSRRGRRAPLGASGR